MNSRIYTKLLIITLCTFAISTVLAEKKETGLSGAWKQFYAGKYRETVDIAKTLMKSKDWGNVSLQEVEDG